MYYYLVSILAKPVITRVFRNAQMKVRAMELNIRCKEVLKKEMCTQAQREIPGIKNYERKCNIFLLECVSS